MFVITFTYTIAVLPCLTCVKLNNAYSPCWVTMSGVFNTSAAAVGSMTY